MPSPLLVLGTGQRCGSTLMQRLISSHPEAFIWGENGGHLLPMLDAVEHLVNRSEWAGTAEVWEEFATSGYQGFMANLMPEPAKLQCHVAYFDHGVVLGFPGLSRRGALIFAGVRGTFRGWIKVWWFVQIRCHWECWSPRSPAMR